MKCEAQPKASRARRIRIVFASGTADTWKAARASRALFAALALVLACASATVAHEERLLVGKVETIDLARKLLVVTRVDAAARHRLEVTPETEVIACRSVTGLGAVRAGGLVRVKYLEKAGSPLEVQSILVLGGGRP